MSADFWAGYLSGACSIIIGNPLDVLKVRLQASSSSSPTVTTTPSSSSSSSSIPTHPPRPRPRNLLFLGTAAPILTYGALNALLFVSYNRSESYLNSFFFSPPTSQEPPQDGKQSTPLPTTFLAGTLSGLATFLVSCPTEIVKVRSQTSQTSSWAVTKQILQQSGIRGLYQAGGVTVLRDSIGYGFYFWGYELSSRWYDAAYFFGGQNTGTDEPTTTTTTGKALLCGGVAGVLTWASIFPLDVIKTRMQTAQQQGRMAERQGLLNGGSGGGGGGSGDGKGKGAWQTGREIYSREGIRPFFRGLGVCSLRAFVVNAVQFAVYEGVMAELSGKKDKIGVLQQESVLG
ncbi:putative mitochondrial ornithine transporter [Cercophora samala]|uniref:Mitochondrial ornithine transporter n=1 Tax=Cercophora samala TaxID=330535 RepID=A0AA39ZG06_9PEZI|nr:putative mitochondrial ornithine transporter [Cercophora samala]